jgi:hypothetical protein
LTATAKKKAAEKPGSGDLRRKALQESRQRRYAEYFDGRKWRIAGKFQLPKGQAFQTPFGHKGRAGWIIQEVVGGTDVPAARKDKGVWYDAADRVVRAAFGWTTLTQAEKMFPGCMVDGVPSRPPRSKPGEEDEPVVIAETSVPA